MWIVVKFIVRVVFLFTLCLVRSVRLGGDAILSKPEIWFLPVNSNCFKFSLPPGGSQHTILPYFPKNCMKLKEFAPPL